MSSARAQQRQKIEIVLPELHPGQQQIVNEAKRFNVLACGRRFGKTTLGIDLLIDPALDGYPTAWFSPTYKMLNEVWREVCRLTKPLQTKLAAQEHRIELLTGGVIDMWSLDSPDSSRGRKYKRAVIDEAAMVAGLSNAWQAVIRPTLTDYRGDAFMLSTPNGLNFFFECFTRGVDATHPEWASWHLPTTANPYISPLEVEAARKELPSLIFDQEYLAQFLQGQGAVFRRIEENLTAPIDATPDDHRGHRIGMGVDWGQKLDRTCLSVGCLDCCVELQLDYFNQLEWAFQRDRLILLARKWNATDILLELNSIGSPNFEALRNDGFADNRNLIGFETTASSKGPLIRSLALALEQMEFRWLPDAVGKAELLAYESKISRVTGHVSYSAPENTHDDTVIARALLRRLGVTPEPHPPAQSYSLSVPTKRR